MTTTASKYQWHDIEGFRYKTIKLQTVLIGNVCGVESVTSALASYEIDKTVIWCSSLMIHKKLKCVSLRPEENMEILIEIAAFIWAPHILFTLIESAVFIWVPHILLIRVWKWGFNHDLSTAYQLNVARSYWCPNMKLKQR